MKVLSRTSSFIKKMALEVKVNSRKAAGVVKNQRDTETASYR